MSAHTNLDAWIDTIGLNLMDVEALQGHQEFEFDFTTKSLANLEEATANPMHKPTKRWA